MDRVKKPERKVCDHTLRSSSGAGQKIRERYSFKEEDNLLKSLAGVSRTQETGLVLVQSVDTS